MEILLQSPVGKTVCLIYMIFFLINEFTEKKNIYLEFKDMITNIKISLDDMESNIQNTS